MSGTGTNGKRSGGVRRWKTRLKEFRKESGQKLRETAASVGVTLGYLSQVEHGCEPSLYVAVKLARHFETTVDVLWPAPEDFVTLEGLPVKLFTTFEVEPAYAHAAAGGQALHLHQIIPDRKTAPWCFVRAVDAGEPIAHLFDQDEDRLTKTCRALGVRVVVVERKGHPGQHVDLCGKPLKKACAALPPDDQRRLVGVLEEFRKRGKGDE